MQPEIKLAIVVAEFNSQITEKMLKRSLEYSAELKVSVTYVCKVPGSYDMPLIIQTLLEKDDVDAVVTLGAIVRGETKHDEVIAYALTSKMADLSLRYRKPVTLGVTGPGITWEQAEARITDYAHRSVASAVKMVLQQREIGNKPHDPTYPVMVD
jgi:6,7-dimethyl-8-ribityllumazine synthase